MWFGGFCSLDTTLLGTNLAKIKIWELILVIRKKRKTKSSSFCFFFGCLPDHNPWLQKSMDPMRKLEAHKRQSWDTMWKDDFFFWKTNNTKKKNVGLFYSFSPQKNREFANTYTEKRTRNRTWQEVEDVVRLAREVKQRGRWWLMMQWGFFRLLKKKII